jgi:predicted nucleotidyltransferase
MTRTKAETLDKLRSNASAIRAFGSTSLYVFGSAARDELSPDSDVDLFIDYRQDGSFTFVEWARLEEYLETLLGRNVDLLTRASLHPRLKTNSERNALQVF